jgi:membrane associated rhomboid family serine protease
MTPDPNPGDAHLSRCSNCGNPTPALNAVCVYCGAVSPEAAKAADQAATEYRFLRAVFTRSNRFTMILIGMNLGVFALEWLAGGMGAMSADHSVLIGFGAKQNALIAEQHQYWRLVTCIFLHIGFIHFLLNNYALWIIGRDIEQIYGSARFLILYVTTGVVASMSSFYFSPNAVSAGASGAIFGLFGVMAAFAFKYRKEIPAALSKDIRRRVLPIIAINLMFGFTARGIVDNAAHIGGLVAGVALALVIPFKHPEEKETPFMWRALQVLCLVVVMASFVAAFRNYAGPRPSFANLVATPGSKAISYFEHMKVANNSLNDSIDELENVPASGSPDWTNALRAVERGTKSAEAAPIVDSPGEEFRTRLLGMLRRQHEVIQRYWQTNRTGRFAAPEEEELSREYDKFIQEFRPWLREFMRQNGFEFEEGSQKARNQARWRLNKQRWSNNLTGSNGAKTALAIS